MKPYHEDNHIKIYNQDCRSMTELPDESVDLLVTDPPYGIGFMGKDWDKALPDKNIWRECLRVLKPGAFAFVMCIPRADCLSRVIISLEDAGFRVDFTPIYWTYASGFPKAQNIGKAVDKRLGTLKVVGKRHNGMSPTAMKPNKGWHDNEMGRELDVLEANSPQAKALDGSYGGFQPKPAVEVIIVCMKPLSEKTFVDQALKNRKGITWLDDCRIPGNVETTRFDPSKHEHEGWRMTATGKETGEVAQLHRGRFPANLLVSDDVLNKSKEDGILVPIYGGQKLREEETGQWTQSEEIVTYALVDKEDYAKVMQYRWNLSTKGYVVCAESKNRNLRLHNLIMQPTEGYEVDHADGNRLDNRKQNLRACSHQQNMMNVNGREGVYEYKDRRKKPFWAYIQRDGKRYSLGYYATYEEAKEVYENKKKELFGDFASRGDSGSFSRYFDLDKWWAKTFPFLIVPKASKSEKNKGIGVAIPRTKHSSTPRKNEAGNKSPNPHPTVKPVKLMAYLITLGSREGDVVLDNFAGSGTSGVAAKLLGRKCVMYEIDEQYCQLAVDRCRQMVLGL